MNIAYVEQYRPNWKDSWELLSKVSDQCFHIQNLHHVGRKYTCTILLGSGQKRLWIICWHNNFNKLLMAHRIDSEGSISPRLHGPLSRATAVVSTNSVGSVMQSSKSKPEMDVALVQLFRRLWSMHPIAFELWPMTYELPELPP